MKRGSPLLPPDTQSWEQHQPVVGLQAWSRGGADDGEAKPRPFRTLDAPHAVCRGVPVTAVCHVDLCVCFN